MHNLYCCNTLLLHVWLMSYCPVIRNTFSLFLLCIISAQTYRSFKNDCIFSFYHTSCERMTHLFITLSRQGRPDSQPFTETHLLDLWALQSGRSKVAHKNKSSSNNVLSHCWARLLHFRHRFLSARLTLTSDSLPSAKHGLDCPVVTLEPHSLLNWLNKSSGPPLWLLKHL